ATDLTPGLMTVAFVGSGKFVAERPEAAERFVLALTEAARLMQGDDYLSAENIEAYLTYTNSTEEALRKGSPVIYDPNVTIPVDGLADVERVHRENGRTDYEEPIDLSKVIDEQFVKAAISALGEHKEWRARGRRIGRGPGPPAGSENDDHCRQRGAATGRDAPENRFPQRHQDLFDGARAGDGNRRFQPRRGRGRVRLHRRPVGMREIHLPAHPRGPGQPYVGHHHRQAGQRSRHAAEQRGLPGIRRFPVEDGDRQRRVRPADARDRQGRAAGDGAALARTGGAVEVRQLLSQPDFRRDEAARLDHQGAGERPGGAADG